MKAYKEEMQARLHDAIFNIVRAMVNDTLPPTLEDLLEKCGRDAALRGDIPNEKLALKRAAFWSDPCLSRLRQVTLSLGAELAELSPGLTRDDVLLILARRLIVCIPPKVLAEMNYAEGKANACKDGAHFARMQRAFVEEEAKISKNAFDEFN